MNKNSVAAVFKSRCIYEKILSMFNLKAKFICYVADEHHVFCELVFLLSAKHHKPDSAMVIKTQRSVCFLWLICCD